MTQVDTCETIVHTQNGGCARGCVSLWEKKDDATPPIGVNICVKEIFILTDTPTHRTHPFFIPLWDFRAIVNFVRHMYTYCEIGCVGVRTLSKIRLRSLNSFKNPIQPSYCAHPRCVRGVYGVRTSPSKHAPFDNPRTVASAPIGVFAKELIK
jgi:hypothetical protein